MIQALMWFTYLSLVVFSAFNIIGVQVRVHPNFWCRLVASVVGYACAYAVWLHCLYAVMP